MHIAHALLPSRVDNYFTTGTEIHFHFTRASKSYRTIQAKSNTKCLSAKYKGPNIWNLIPATIQVAPNMSLFKRYLQKHLTRWFSWF